MAHIVKEIPDAQLVILGSGEMEPMLNQMVHDLHLEKNILPALWYRFRRERLLYYAAADVCVFPSKYEPFGMSVPRQCPWENCGCRSPWYIGVPGTVIPRGDGICGYHINPYDPLDIANYIIDILKKPDLLQ